MSDTIDVKFLGFDITNSYGICQDRDGNFYLIDKDEALNMRIGSTGSVYQSDYNTFGYSLLPF